MSAAFRHCDPDALLAAVGHDRASFKRLARMFIASTAETADGLQQAHLAGDRGALLAHCHALRGGAVILGAAGLQEVLVDWEQRLRRGQGWPDHATLTGLCALLGQLSGELQRACGPAEIA